MKEHSSASDITDIICLSEGLPVSRTPLKQLVTTKACNFKRLPLLLHPVESSLVPISLIYTLIRRKKQKKPTKGLKSKSIKVVKRHSRHLVTLLYSEEMRQLCGQQET